MGYRLQRREGVPPVEQRPDPVLDGVASCFRDTDAHSGGHGQHDP
jgi:hypothetical protein